MRKQTLCVTLLICLPILIAGSWLARAGDLDPPAGPVAPTMRTLDELSSEIGEVKFEVDKLVVSSGNIGAIGSTAAAAWSQETKTWTSVSVGSGVQVVGSD
ncbi:MAG: hypothetical protein GY842_29200 [bacterium]|nr:hypothetical protein [bacterium]